MHTLILEIEESLTMSIVFISEIEKVAKYILLFSYGLWFESENLIQ